MATTLSNDISKFLLAGLDKYFSENWENWPTEYPRWCASRAFPKIVSLLQNVGNLALADEVIENNPVTYNILNETVQTSLTLKPYGVGLSHSLVAKEGDQYGMVDAARMKELMRSLVQKLEKIAIKPWDEAFDTVQADGVAMCATAKLCYDSGDTFATKLASGGTIQASGGANMITAIQYMATQKNAQGQPFVAIADTLKTHAVNQLYVESLFGSALMPFQTSTQINLQSKNPFPRMKAEYSHYITEQDYWFIEDTGIDHVIAGHKDSMPTPRVKSEEDMDTWATKSNIVYLFGAASVPNPGIVGSSGA